jgi:hypothetical protein
MPFDDSMKSRVGLIERTNPNAIGAMTSVFGPPGDALFRIDRPF